MSQIDLKKQNQQLKKENKFLNKSLLSLISEHKTTLELLQTYRIEWLKQNVKTKKQIK